MHLSSAGGSTVRQDCQSTITSYHQIFLDFREWPNNRLIWGESLVCLPGGGDSQAGYIDTALLWAWWRWIYLLIVLINTCIYRTIDENFRTIE